MLALEVQPLADLSAWPSVGVRLAALQDALAGGDGVSVADVALLRTFALRERTAPLTVYGPEGTKALLGALGPVLGKVPYPLAVVELEPGQEVAGDGYRLEAIGTRHRVPSVGWYSIEPRSVKKRMAHFCTSFWMPVVTCPLSGPKPGRMG